MMFVQNQCENFGHRGFEALSVRDVDFSEFLFLISKQEEIIPSSVWIIGQVPDPSNFIEFETITGQS
jgi:hypothetical protein